MRDPSRLIIVLAGVLGLTIWAFISVFIRGDNLKKAGQRIGSQSYRAVPTARTVATQLTQSRAKNVVPKKPLPSVAGKARWPVFSGKYGSHLKPVFLDDGRLVSVEGGNYGMGSTADVFDPSDKEQVMIRAMAILADLKDLIGYQESLPLRDPLVRATPTSAQVFLKQTSSGVGLEPYGNLSMNLGMQGEVLSISSDYVPKIKIGNSVAVSQAKAGKLAGAAVPGSPVPKGGKAIIWVMSRTDPSGVVAARRAYEFYISGRRVVVDAETGKILHKKDQRRF